MKEELEQLDIKSRKPLTISGSFHKNNDIDRLYTIRKGGRGFSGIVDTTFAEPFPLIYTLEIT